jgi:AGZA family xanthine/uracil permease-like MFS transporter
MASPGFALRERGSTLSRELVGGTSTFLALSYILFVQPGLLAQTGMDREAVFYGTCLASALATLLMAFTANYPIALAPGMGENFFFAYTLCAAVPLGFGLTWQQALAATFLAGLAFMGLARFGVREKLVNSVPPSLQAGIAAGIGLFITFIGLQYGNLVVSHPGTLVRLGSLREPATLVTLAGLLVAIVLVLRGVRGALLIAILTSTGVAAALGLVRYHGLASTRFRLAPILLHLDFAGLFGRPVYAVVTSIAILFFLALFDTVGTLVGLAQQAGLMRAGRLPKAERALFADAAGSAAGACLGSTTITCYIESAAGIADGARTGIANLATAALFLLAMLFGPLVSMVGGGVMVAGAEGATGVVRYPTIAPALILVGSMMMRTVKEIDWNDPTEFTPAFLTLVGIPLTFSIATGVALGFISYALAKLVTGRARSCPTLVYVFAVLLAIMLIISH